MPRRAMTYLLLIAAALTVSACGYSAAAEENGDGPAKVEAIEDSVVLDVFSPVRDDWVRGDDAYLRG